MDGHAPYIMPDGRSLKNVLRAEALPSKKQQSRSTQHRAKDELWGQLQRNKRTAGSEQELAEIRAIERVGHRRRRQWLNDKLLRDLAGPMSTQDMEGQFNPCPFGTYAPPSPFVLAAAPEHAPLWDSFRSIDPDKEAKVLERWQAYNQQQQQQQQQSSGPAVLTGHQQQQAAAAAALAKWGCVGKAARAALKKASVHSVLTLEVQVLQLLEQDDATAELLLEVPDGFGRLLVHGLAQFHGLHSTTRVVGGEKAVALQHRAPGQQQQPQQQPQQQKQDDAMPHHHSAESRHDGGSASEAAQQPSSTEGGSGEAAGGGASATWLSGHADITCTDVVMALHELGSTFDQHTLGGWVRSMHGSEAAGCERAVLLVA